jgi:acetyl-CoA C-acetyltransferase
MTGVCIVGWAHSPFGKLADPDIESLMGRVVGPAIADAEMSPSGIDGIFVGHFNSGFSKQNFPSSLTMQGVPELRFKPATRLENACASGSAAIFAAID